MAVGTTTEDLMKAAAIARANQRKAQEAAKAMSARIKGTPPPPPKPPAGDSGGEAK